jgi:hypothetical protein
MGELERETNRLWTFPEGMVGHDDSLKGFRVEAVDGDAGTVAWASYAPGESYLVVSLSHHLHETHHVVPAAAVERISKSERKAWLRVTRADVESAPEHHDEPSPLPPAKVDDLTDAWSTFLLRG